MFSTLNIGIYTIFFSPNQTMKTNYVFIDNSNECNY